MCKRPKSREHMCINSTLYDKIKGYQNGVETHARGWRHKHIITPKSEEVITNFKNWRRELSFTISSNELRNYTCLSARIILTWKC